MKGPAVLSYDDAGGSGPLVILLPGAGDVRSENRFLAADLAAAGYRVVNADLPGHGGSPPAASYGVAEAADALLALIDVLDAGPAVVVGTSFAPAAAVWVAAERPDRIAAVVAISPHLEAGAGLKDRLLRLSIGVLLRGPWAAPVWTRLYRSWYKSRTPDDLDAEIAAISAMLRDPTGRRAARETLTAGREGLDERIRAYARPTLVVFGAADDHFPDPAAEAARVAARLGGETVLVPGAGHYPHAERPDVVGPAVVAFVDGVTGRGGADAGRSPA